MTNVVVMIHVTNVKRVGVFSEGYDSRGGMDYTIMRTDEAADEY